jgi:hypothetical protein
VTHANRPAGAATIQAGNISFTGNGIDTSTAGLAAVNAITMSALGDLSVGDLDAGGSIALAGSDIDTTAGTVQAGGALGIAARATLTTGTLIAGSEVTLSGASVDTTAGAVQAGATIEIAVISALTTGALTSGTDLLLSGNSVDTTRGALTAGNDVVITAGTSLATSDINAGTAGGEIALTGSHVVVAGRLSAPLIAVRSSDITITEEGQIGQQGLTQIVTLTAASNKQTIIGGDDTPGGEGYTLDAPEAGRIRSDALVISAPAAANGDPVLVRRLELDGGTLGSLTLTTPGVVRFEGAVSVVNAGVANFFNVDATRIEVVTSTGSIRMRDASGSPAGTLRLSASDIAVMSPNLMNRFGSLTPEQQVDALRTNNGPVEARGYVEAGTIRLIVGNSVFVQNSGTDDTFAGLATGPGGLIVERRFETPLDAILFGAGFDTAPPTTGEAYFRDTFDQQGGAGGFNNRSELNRVNINTGLSPTPTPTPTPAPTPEPTPTPAPTPTPEPTPTPAPTPTPEPTPTPAPTPTPEPTPTPAPTPTPEPTPTPTPTPTTTAPPPKPPAVPIPILNSVQSAGAASVTAATGGFGAAAAAAEQTALEQDSASEDGDSGSSFGSARQYLVDLRSLSGEEMIDDPVAGSSDSTTWGDEEDDEEACDAEETGAAGGSCQPAQGGE